MGPSVLYTHIHMDMSQHVEMNGHPFHQFYPMVLEKPFFLNGPSHLETFPSHFIPSVASCIGASPWLGSHVLLSPKRGGAEAIPKSAAAEVVTSKAQWLVEIRLKYGLYR